MIRALSLQTLSIFAATFFALAISASAFAQQVLRVTTIPEEAATEQVRKFGPLTKYLERTQGMKVEFIPVNDYPAAVEALVNKQVDLVWFGGFTRSGTNSFWRKNHSDRTTRGRHQVSFSVYCAKKLWHHQTYRFEG